LPSNWVGDAIYGTEENLAYAETKECNAFLKYPTFHRESQAKYRNDPYRAENFTYDPANDCFTCPQDRRLTVDHEYIRTTQSGFPIHIHRYRCLDCSDCPLKSQCTRGQGNRQIDLSWNNWRLKEIARQLLTSEKGLGLRARRGWEVEGVFGHIKFNRQFRRFMLRGLQKVRTELGLLSFAHNMIKLAAA
jgi:hypothetical protein